MANEVSYATLLANGGRVARILSAKLHENLYDPTGLRALMDLVPWRGMQESATTNVTKVARGLVMAAAGTEVASAWSNTALTTTNYDLTVARYGAIMAPTDLFRMTGGPIDTDYVVGILAESLDLTLTDLLVALFASVAGNVGTSGADLTVDDFFDGIYYLNLYNNPPQLVAVLHNQQVNDLIEALRSETGPMQWRTDAQNMLQVSGVGFKGQFAGVGVFQSDSVATANAGADRCGAMFSMGAFAYQLGAVSDMQPNVDPADIVIATPELYVERDRDATNGITKDIVNAYPGVAEQEDLRACRMTTDA